MAFTRPVNVNALSKEKKLALTREYVSHYEREAALDPTTLNRKVPREAFSELLDRIGGLLLQESRRMATEPGPICEFLDATALPSSMRTMRRADFQPLVSGYAY